MDHPEAPVVVPETPSAPYFEGAMGFAPSASQLLFHHTNLRPTGPVFDEAYLNPVFDEAELPPAYDRLFPILK